MKTHILLRYDGMKVDPDQGKEEKRQEGQDCYRGNRLTALNIDRY